MTRSSNKPAKPDNPKRHDQHTPILGPADLARLSGDFAGMKLIPWRDIWGTLSVAKTRGNRRMIEVFYDRLFRDAVFDDRGAWSIEIKKPH